MCSCLWIFCSAVCGKRDQGEGAKLDSEYVERRAADMINEQLLPLFIVTHTCRFSYSGSSLDLCGNPLLALLGSAFRDRQGWVHLRSSHLGVVPADCRYWTLQPRRSRHRCAAGLQSVVHSTVLQAERKGRMGFTWWYYPVRHR